MSNSNTEIKNENNQKEMKFTPRSQKMFQDCITHLQQEAFKKYKGKKRNDEFTVKSALVFTQAPVDDIPYISCVPSIARTSNDTEDSVTIDALPGAFNDDNVGNELRQQGVSDEFLTTLGDVLPLRKDDNQLRDGTLHTLALHHLCKEICGNSLEESKFFNGKPTLEQAGAAGGTFCLSCTIDPANPPSKPSDIQVACIKVVGTSGTIQGGVFDTTAKVRREHGTVSNEHDIPNDQKLSKDQIKPYETFINQEILKEKIRQECLESLSPFFKEEEKKAKKLKKANICYGFATIAVLLIEIILCVIGLSQGWFSPKRLLDFSPLVLGIALVPTVCRAVYSRMRHSGKRRGFWVTSLACTFGVISLGVGIVRVLSQHIDKLSHMEPIFTSPACLMVIVSTAILSISAFLFSKDDNTLTDSLRNSSDTNLNRLAHTFYPNQVENVPDYSNGQSVGAKNENSRKI